MRRQSLSCDLLPYQEWRQVPIGVANRRKMKFTLDLYDSDYHNTSNWGAIAIKERKNSSPEKIDHGPWWKAWIDKYHISCSPSNNGPTRPAPTPAKREWLGRRRFILYCFSVPANSVELISCDMTCAGMCWTAEAGLVLMKRIRLMILVLTYMR